jgi:hypothetical protein
MPALIANTSFRSSPSMASASLEKVRKGLPSASFQNSRRSDAAGSIVQTM